MKLVLILIFLKMDLYWFWALINARSASNCHIVKFEFTGWVYTENLQYDIL